jgi:Xaa-Pro aminopeptidase
MNLQAPPVSEYSQRQIIEKTTHAADVATLLLQEISAFLRPGVTEGQARMEAIRIFERNGVDRSWHKPYIYFGTNTLLTFKDKPQEEKTLQEEDIAYIDIGPIVGDVEGDVGHTLVFGNNLLFLEIKATTEQIFNQGRRYWMEHNATGVELYEYIETLTKDAGYIFNLEPAGHLIGSFPHKGWKEGLNTYPYPVEPGIWILEVQIRHPEQPYGGFQEAVLV